MRQVGLTRVECIKDERRSQTQINLVISVNWFTNMTWWWC